MAQLMKLLPTDVSSFSVMRTGNYLYIDKTEQIYNLFNRGQRYYFLARPRRFGKSLLISTLKELFLGNKKLFEGLWIYNSDYDWKQYAVIHLDFASIANNDHRALEESLKEQLDKIALSYSIDISDTTILKSKLFFLVTKLGEKNKVVFLIDEYDKPILNHISNTEQAELNRAVLSDFYDTIKGLDEHLRAIFLTGVTKFSKTSLFSGLNNLNDITIDPVSASLLGYTENELTSNFNDQIASLAKEENVPTEQLLQKIKKWYNGYQFSDKPLKVYNPFSILYLFQKLKFLNFWFTSGTPTFLIKLLKTQYQTLEELEETELSFENLGYFQITNIPLVPLLFQTGYLTITDFDKKTNKFKLGFPNFEVENSFQKYLITVLTDSSSIKVDDSRTKLIKALKANNLAEFCSILKSLFAHIPYTLHIKKESYYHSLFQFLMSFLSLEAQSERLTNRGRIDMHLELNDIVYIFELKLNADPSKALEQIHQKKYYEPFLITHKKIILVGLAFTITDDNELEIDYKSEELTK